MDQKNFLPISAVRQVESYPAVEAPRSQKRRVEYIRTIGGRHHDNLFIGLEAIEFDQNLIESLFALVIATANPSPSHSANRVYFVNEDNGRRRFLGQVEEIAHA